MRCDARPCSSGRKKPSAHSFPALTRATPSSSFSQDQGATDGPVVTSNAQINEADTVEDAENAEGAGDLEDEEQEEQEEANESDAAAVSCRDNPTPPNPSFATPLHSHSLFVCHSIARRLKLWKASWRRQPRLMRRRQPTKRCVLRDARVTLRISLSSCFSSLFNSIDG